LNGVDGRSTRASGRRYWGSCKREMDQDTKDQLARQYQTSIEDIRLFKNTQWRITTTCYAIFGAMIWASEKVKNFECIGSLLIVAGAVVVAAVVARAGIKGVCET